MDLSGQRVLAYLQEDNTQRVLFRVRPLLSPQGLIAAEEIAAYRDHGFLRVAPDRQEQHTFKERMRELGSLCLLDLQDAAQGKVRPNRNYAPGRGENNRYIVYSDAIKPLPQDMVYEVVVKEDSRHAPLTPRYYVRSGGFINGPFTAQGEQVEGASQTLPPDCDRLFLVAMPDNQHRMFYWPEMPEAPGSECAPLPEEDRPHAEPHGAARSLADLFFRRKQPLLMPQDSLGQAAIAMGDALRHAGFICEETHASHLLLVFLLFQRFQLSSPAIADAVTAGEAMANLMNLKPILTLTGEVPPDSIERMILSPLPTITADARRKVILSQAHSVAPQNTAVYALSPWPVVSVEASEAWPLDLTALAALNLLQLKQQVREHPIELSDAANDTLNNWQRRLIALEAPLPLILKRDITFYLRHAHVLLAQETALGYAAADFVLPYALSKGVPADALRALFADLPEALALL